MSMTIFNPVNNLLHIPRPHSAGPFTNYHNNYGQLAVLGNDDAPINYLLGLFREQRMRGVDERTVIEDWVMQCPELDSRYRNPLAHEEVSDAFWRVLKLVDRYQATPVRGGVSEQLHMMLSQALQQDMMRASPGDSNTTIASQHLFRSLAYVSYRYHSAQLGQVLYWWFVENLQHIVQYNSQRALWQWCNAILDSSMGHEHKHDCLSKLRLHRPDLFHSSEVRENESAVRQLPQLIRELIDILDDRRPSYSRRTSSSYRSRRSSRAGYRSGRARREELEEEDRDLRDRLQRNKEARKRLDHRQYGYVVRSRSSSRGYI